MPVLDLITDGLIPEDSIDRNQLWFGSLPLNLLKVTSKYVLCDLLVEMLGQNQLVLIQDCASL